VRGIAEAVRKAAKRQTGAYGTTHELRCSDDCFYMDEDAIRPLWKSRRFRLQPCISGYQFIDKVIHPVL